MTNYDFIKAYYDDFEYRTRSDNTRYVCLKTDEFRDINMKAHGTEFLPDDFRYETIYSLLGALLDYSYKDEINEATNEQELFDIYENDSHEIVGSLIPVSSYYRLQWYSSNLNRSSYVDEAKDEGLISSDATIEEQCAGGIEIEIREIYTNLICALGEQIEELNNE
jgi:hypothetical protein